MAKKIKEAEVVHFTGWNKSHVKRILRRVVTKDWSLTWRLSATELQCAMLDAVVMSEVRAAHAANPYIFFSAPTLLLLRTDLEIELAKTNGLSVRKSES